jgi:hypothetical protein
VACTIATAKGRSPLVGRETIFMRDIYKSSKRLGKERNGFTNQNRGTKKNKIADEDE